MSPRSLARAAALRRGALALALVALPGVAAAAACCMSATSFGTGRLAVWEAWAVGVRLGHERSLGQWDQGGSLRRNPPGFSDGLSRLEPWAIVRVHPRVQLQGWLPVLVNDRSSGGQRQTAGGVGDAGAAARLEVLAVGEWAGLPSLAFTVGGVAPTGRTVDETRAPLFAGVTGRGAWGGSVSLEAEYAVVPWFVRLDAGATRYLPFRRAGTDALARYGTVLQAGLSAGREVVPDATVAALALTGEWEGPTELAGTDVPGSRARSLGLAASLSWHAGARWTLVGTLSSNVWPDGVGANRDARVGFTLGVRHAGF